MKEPNRLVQFNTEPSTMFQDIWWRMSSLRGYYKKEAWENIGFFVQFIGYPRSGHSLVGSLINAHPNCGIAHELDALYYLNSGYSRFQLYQRIVDNINEFNRSGRKWMGYDYNFGNSQDVGHAKWTHIGDKCGGRTTRRIAMDTDLDVFYRIGKLTNAEVRIIHVVRNPMDNISTMALRTADATERLIQNTLGNAINRYTLNAKTNFEIINRYEDLVLTVHYENLLSNTEIEVERIFNHLSLKMDEDLVIEVKAKIWDQPNKSRYKLRDYWDSSRIDKIVDLCNSIEFLQCYLDDVNFNE